MQPVVTLTVTESRCGKPLERGNGSEEKPSNVTLSLAQVVVGFGFGYSHGGCDQADPGGLLGGVETKAVVEWKCEKAFVKIFECGGGLTEGDDGGAQLGFSFCFLVGLVDAVEIGVAEQPGGG